MLDNSGFKPMTESEVVYRGYKVTLERDWSGRYMAISPTRPELPIVSRHSSRLASDLRDAEVLQHAERRIDTLLRFAAKEIAETHAAPKGYAC
jgi:hypothetical protein